MPDDPIQTDQPTEEIKPGEDAEQSRSAEENPKPEENPTPEPPKAAATFDVEETPTETPKEEPKPEEKAPEETKPEELKPSEEKKSEESKPSEPEIKIVEKEVIKEVKVVDEAELVRQLDEKLKSKLMENKKKADEARTQKRKDNLAQVVELAKKKEINNQDVRDLLQVSQSTATNYLTELVKSGRLKSEKKAKAKVYKS
jgi:hypothetical protein